MTIHYGIKRNKKPMFALFAQDDSTSAGLYKTGKCSQFNAELTKLEEKYRNLSAAYDQYYNLLDAEETVIFLSQKYMNEFCIYLNVQGMAVYQMHKRLPFNSTIVLDGGYSFSFLFLQQGFCINYACYS